MGISSDNRIFIFGATCWISNRLYRASKSNFERRAQIKMKKVKEIGSRALSQMIDITRLGWPPDCMGYLYQPERPMTKNSLKGESEKSDSGREE